MGSYLHLSGSRDVIGDVTIQYVNRERQNLI